jgi:hypothetical protein
MRFRGEAIGLLALLVTPTTLQKDDTSAWEFR